MKVTMQTTTFLAVLALGLAVSATAAQVLLPDNGSGTVSMPIAAAYDENDLMFIIDGLPPGSNIQITSTIVAPVVGYEEAGGNLGGTRAGYGGNLFQWSMQGTGIFSGYSRNLTFPPMPGSILSFTPTPSTLFDATGAPMEIHTAPRTLGGPVQIFNTTLFRGFSQLIGDPDFDLLRVTMGNDFGLPSPGQTTFTSVGGGNWNVESYFDITYRIDFIGSPGGPFAGRSGSTTGTARFSLGDPVPEPAVAGLCAIGLVTIAFRRVRRTKTDLHRPS